jgi:DNA adenine methylase
MKLNSTEGSREQLPRCYPFVKWAGGKSQLLSKIETFIPTDINRYFEPFLGGGALFFYLSSRKNFRFDAFLSDINQELLISYNAVRYSVEELISILKHHQEHYRVSPKEYYYRLRDRTHPTNNVESAARLLALNKTCYNGLYRVNKEKKFNVPMGRFNNPTICDAENLRNVSNLLRELKPLFLVEDYKKLLIEKAREGDFIYLDPPYSPVSVTANFTAYTNNGFGQADQIQLADLFGELDGRGCNILLSNSDNPFIRKLYTNFSDLTVQIDARRAINSKATERSGHTELLIRNYN